MIASWFYRYSRHGKLLTGEGPQTGSPASRLGVGQRPRRRAVSNLRRRHKNKVAAAHAPVCLTQRGRFPAVIRAFQEVKPEGCLAVATADHKAAYFRPPACGDNKGLYALTPRKT